MGYSPLRTPKLWSSSKKAKKRRSAAFFFTLFHSSPIDPPGLDSLWFYRGCRGAQCAPVAVCVIAKFAGEQCSPLPDVCPIRRGRRPRRPVLAPEGPDGEGRKSVKKRAALLHGLAFLLLDLLFGVLRGERLAAKTMAASLLRKPARAVIRPAGANIARSPVSPRSTVAPCSQPRNPLRRGCAVAKQSKPQWGFEAHERARFAGWRRSLCAAKRALSQVAGTFSVPFGCPKGPPKSSLLLTRESRRKVAALVVRRQARAIASSGHLFGSFWVSKRNT